MQLVDLQEAKDHLAVDHAVFDAQIDRMIHQASGAVLNYLKGAPIGEPVRDEQGRIETDSNGDVIYEEDSSGLVVRHEIKAAVLILIAEFFKHREAEQDGEVEAKFGYGYLPRPVVSLLYPLRDPALA